MLRILAFDIGEKRIGVAVSDPLGITAQGIETYHRTDDLEKDVAHLISIANGYKPVKLVFRDAAQYGRKLRHAGGDHKGFC